MNTKLTFAQREGAAAIPQQLKLKQMSAPMRAYLWGAVYKDFEKSIGITMHAYLTKPWLDIMRDVHVDRKHLMANTYHPDVSRITHELSILYAQGGYAEVLDFTEWLLQHPNCSEQMRSEITEALEKSRSAYRVVDGDTIVAMPGEYEGAAVAAALVDTADNGFPGSHTHLKNAAKELRDGDHAASVRESISAVEAIGTVLEPGAKFAAALSKLESRFGIHGGLKAGFGSLYGFTSDEKGIRHALGDIPNADVAEEDAIYMLGACASFVSYLIAKARKIPAK